MILTKTLRRLVVAGVLSCALPTGAFSQEQASGPTSFDDIVVTAKSKRADPTEIAADAEFLLHTAGDGNDPLKALLALPGISFGAGDMDRPVVRGAGPANNLFLVDDIPLPDLFHELSDSIISANVLRSFDLHSAAVTNRFGGATGGAIDIKLRDPVRDGVRLGVDLSQLKSGAILEGAITDNLSAYASQRVNLAHLFLKNFATGNALLEFRMPQSTDYTAKAVWRMGRASVSATALGAWDRRKEVQRADLNLPPLFGLTETRRVDAQSLRFAVPVGAAGEWTTTLANIRSVESSAEVNGDFARLESTALSLRSHLTIPFDAVRFEGGVNAESGETKLSRKGAYPICDFLERRCGIAVSPALRSEERRFEHVEAYAGAVIALGDRLSLDAGGRWIRDFTLKQEFWEPRAGISWSASDALSLYLRGSRQHERPEPERLLLFPALIDRQRYQSSWQALIGARVEIAGGWRAQLEGWHKDFDIADMIDTPIASRIDGRAHGLNLLVTKPAGDRFDGWLSLSRTWSDRNLQPGNAAVPYRYDIPWSGAIAATWHISPSLSFGGKWRVQSGARYTPLIAVTQNPLTGAVVQQYGEPYSARAPLYSRVDLRIEKSLKIGKIPLRFYVDALNILDRVNVAERSFPLANVQRRPDGSLIGRPADDAGIPRFVAVGAGFSF
jgi:outer membrane receptor protein involved in Fe transport